MKTNTLAIVLIISSMFFIVSCDKTKNLESDYKQQSVVIADSPAERSEQALKLIESYSMDEWENDIILQISDVTGSVVSEEIRSEVRRTLSDQDLLNKRVSLLTEVYTAHELASLARLYSTKDGKNLLKKIITHEKRLRETISPLVIEVMSNANKAN